MKVQLAVNGSEVSADVEDRLLLVHFLRDVAGLTATNVGCDTTSCGACTVLLDGESVKSCTVLAAQAGGHEVTTVEGLASDGEMHPVQRAFHTRHALQCGFCTPGMVMAIVSLLRGEPAPHRGAGTRRPGRQPVPLHGLPQHRRGRPRRSAGAGPRGEGPGSVRVIPSSFTYRRADSAAEALDLAAEYGEDAKYLAGGHSLLPLMKLRLAAPGVLIDLGGLRDLSYITDHGPHIAIGALARHHDIEHSELLGSQLPLLAHAAGQVGDPQVRHRGTIGGSVAHADPASDLPAVLLALDATLVASGPGGGREIPVAEFFRGFFETALEPGELLTEIRVPKPAPGSRGWSFQKFTQRAIDWAIVGVAVQGGNVALGNMGPVPLRAAAVEAALAGGAPPAEAAMHAADGTSPGLDIRASSGYREHLARVLVSRALAQATSGS